MCASGLVEAHREPAAWTSLALASTPTRRRSGARYEREADGRGSPSAIFTRTEEDPSLLGDSDLEAAPGRRAGHHEADKKKPRQPDEVGGAQMVTRTGFEPMFSA
jgi:hypothetical protein